MADAPTDAGHLFDEGESLIDAGDDAGSLAIFLAAWAAIPEPKADHELAVPVLGAIADGRFFAGDWEGCRWAVQEAFRCGAETDNVFLRLRLGQSLFELGDVQEAANWLTPVYLAEGREPFAGEDPKYLASFQPRLAPPPGGWPVGW